MIGGWIAYISQNLQNTTIDNYAVLRIYPPQAAAVGGVSIEATAALVAGRPFAAASASLVVGGSAALLAAAPQVSALVPSSVVSMSASLSTPTVACTATSPVVLGAEAAASAVQPRIEAEVPMVVGAAVGAGVGLATSSSTIAMELGGFATLEAWPHVQATVWFYSLSIGMPLRLVLVDDLAVAVVEDLGCGASLELPGLASAVVGSEPADATVEDQRCGVLVL